jgi:hypothetical protein
MRQILVTIWSAIVIAAILLCISPFVLYLVGDFVHRQEVYGYQRQWESNRITRYKITLMHAGLRTFGMELDVGVTLTIIEDKVIGASERYCNGCNRRPLAVYQQYPINGLFDEAYDCYLFCGVKYDTKFSFPKRIGGGFIEGGWVEVIAFVPIEYKANR